MSEPGNNGSNGYRSPDASLREIVGRHVRLEALGERHRDLLYRMEIGSSLLERWRFRGRTPSRLEFDASLDAGTHELLAVVDRQSSEFLGVVSSYNPDVVNGFLYLAIVRAPELTRSWFMEGVVLFIDHLFEAWPIRKIYGEVAEYNLYQFASGEGRTFEIEARLAEHLYYQGRYWDQYVLAIHRDRWIQRGRRLADLARENGRRSSSFGGETEPADGLHA